MVPLDPTARPAGQSRGRAPEGHGIDRRDRGAADDRGRQSRFGSPRSRSGASVAVNAFEEVRRPGAR